MQLKAAHIALAVLMLSTSTSAASLQGEVGIRLLIVSNSVDMDAAIHLKELLEDIGYWNVTIASAELYPELARLTKVDVVMILGGPLAYEGVGRLSSTYLPTDALRELMKPGGLGYWIVEVVDDVLVYVIIAGHTRVETRAAVDLYMREGVWETYLLVAAELAQSATPELITQLSRLGLHPMLSAEAVVIGKASLASIPKLAAHPAVVRVTPAIRHIVLVSISEVIP